MQGTNIQNGMKIHVNQIPAEGVTEHARYDPTTMEMDREDIHVTTPFEAEAAIRMVDEELVATVELRYRLDLVCARCLEPFDSDRTTQAVLSYHVQPEAVLDITEDLRQEIILAYPMIPVCQTTCRGLCRFCGQNLNVTSCQHTGQVGYGDPHLVE